MQKQDMLRGVKGTERFKMGACMGDKKENYDGNGVREMGKARWLGL